MPNINGVYVCTKSTYPIFSRSYFERKVLATGRKVNLSNLG